MMKVFKLPLVLAYRAFIATVETPFVVFYVLSKIRKMDKYVAVSNEISFGRQIVTYDSLSRLYYPNKVLILEIVHFPRNSEYLKYLFTQNLQFETYKSVFFAHNFHTSATISRLIKLVVQIVLIFKKNAFYIDHYQIESILSSAKGDIIIGDYQGLSLTKYIDYTGYARLIREGIGKPPQLPKDLRGRVELNISSKYPSFFDKKTAVLLLRGKGVKSLSFVDRIRDAGDHLNYLDAIEYLSSKGYNIVALGETQTELFKNVQGFYSVDSFDESRSLLEIYFLSTSSLVVCQHSGPPIIADSCDIPVLLCDSMPLWQGRFSRKSIMLYKNIYQNGKKLTYREIFSHKKLSYGCFVSEFDIRPNTSRQILLATREIIKMIEGGFEAEMNELMQNNNHYFSLFKDDMLNYYLKTPIPAVELSNVSPS